MMAKTKTVHYNPPVNNGKTRCGLQLRSVEHRTDPNDSTCNTCNRLHKLDQRFGT